MTKNFDNYFFKAVHQAKIEDLKERYAEKGFEEENGIIGTNGNEYFDLLLHHKKNDKIVAFQVMLTPISKSESAKIEQAKNVAKKKGYEFRLVAIVRPPLPKIEIDWLKEKFWAYLRDNVPDSIADKAPHVLIENLEIVLVSIEIIENEAKVQAEGSIDVNLQYDSDQEEDGELFPFTTELRLNLTEQSIIEATKIKIDDSMFY